MSNTTISEVGKFFQTNGNAVNAVTKQTPSVGVQNNFGTMLKQTKGNNAAKNVQNTATNSSNDITQKFKSYQYKDKVVKSEKIDTVSEDTVKEELDKFSDGVKEVLKEELGVSEEQIENAMQMLGLQFSDLMNQNNLAGLVSTLTGADSIQQLLCNEQFVTIMQGVGELGKDLLADLNMNMDEFQNVLNEMINPAENLATDNIQQDAVTLEDGMNQESFLGQADEKASASSTIGEERQSVAAQNSGMNEQQDTDVNAKTDTVSQADATEETESFVQQDIAQNTNAEDDDQTDFLNQQKQPQADNKFNVSDASQTPQEAAFSQTQIIENFDNVETSVPLPENVNTRDVIDQIVETAKVAVDNQKATMELQLNPENLGKIILKVSQEDGMLTAKLTTQSAIVKEALETQLVELRQNLEQAGVKVDAVEVTVASHEFEKNLEQNAEGGKQQGEQQEREKNAPRRLNLNDLSELSGVMSEEETLVAKMMAEQGNSVDYTV